MILRHYILAYFKTEITDPRDTLRLNIPMDVSFTLETYIRIAALTVLTNHGLEFTKFYAVDGEHTTDITELVKEDIIEIKGE